MGMNQYWICIKDCPVESRDDLLTAMRRSRHLAEKFNTIVEIRDEFDTILAVSIGPDVQDRRMTMPKAAKHNAQLALQRQRLAPDEAVCPATSAAHDWQEEQPKHRQMFRCSSCRCLGYQIDTAQIREHRCTTCGALATVERPRNLLRHRWSCDKHVDD